jgi:RNA polymerase sigma factor (sigma-70 family)
MHHSAVHQTIATVWRLESARIVATVARRVRDLALAEELAQDALVAALEHWPRDGLPANPAAWLMTTAQHRALDHLRHVQMAQARHEDIAADRAARGDDRVPDIAEALDQTREGLADDVLRLMFVACHPLLSPEARVALTLRLVGGLSTQEIARAHLVPEATVAQRIVRAQRTLTQAGVPFEVPRGPGRAARLASVLEVVYAIFNEGHNASAGDDWMRPALCDEALRLARSLAALAPHEPEALGLLALLELTAARSPARRDAEGRPVLLEQQDRRRWDRCCCAAAWRCWRRRRPWRVRARGPTRCRPPSPRAMRVPTVPKTPIGPRSPRCTRGWPRSRLHRWCNSTARWPSRVPTARRRGWCWWKPCCTSRP